MYCNVLIFIHTYNLSKQSTNVGQKRPQVLHPYYPRLPAGDVGDELLPAGDGGDELLPAGDGGDELEAVRLLQQVLPHCPVYGPPSVQLRILVCNFIFRVSHEIWLTEHKIAMKILRIANQSIDFFTFFA